MTTRAGVLAIILVILGILSANAYSPTYYTFPDSTKNNKSNNQVVMHRVEAGQTLYGLVRKYNTTIKLIKQANPGMKDNLVTGQVIKIPVANKPTSAETPKSNTPSVEKEKVIVTADFDSKEPSKSKEKAESAPIEKTEKITIPADNPLEPATVPPAATAAKPAEKVETKSAVSNPKTGIHIVEAGQSLYGIAVKYSVLMADIRRWNSLANDHLRAGQELIVSEQIYQDYIRRNKIDTVKFAEAKKASVEKILPPREDPTNANLPEPKLANSGKRVLETGVAEVIEGIDNSKYLALHRTAPIGSLIQVKNTNNNNSVWVKVIGKLPDISANNRIIIKLSSRAQEKLSPNGKQFIAEISYLSQ